MEIISPAVSPRGLVVADILAAAPDLAYDPSTTRRRTVRPSHPFADALSIVHAAEHAWQPVLVDAVVLSLTAVLLAGGRAWPAVAFGPLTVLLAYAGQLYTDRDPVQTRGFLWYAARIFVPLVLVVVPAVLVHEASVGTAAAAFAGGLGATSGMRVLSWTALSALRRRGLGLRRTLIIGDPDLAGLVWRRLVDFPEAGLVPVQLISWEAARQPGSLAQEMAGHGVQHVVLAAPGREDAMLLAHLPRHKVNAPSFSMVPALSELFLDPHSVTEVGGVPLVPLGRVTRARQAFPGKRALDVAASALGLLVLLPVLAVVALAIRVDDGGPVLYSQRRVGRDGNLFWLRKFRTMVVDAETQLADLEHLNETDGLLFKIKDDPRITRVGRVLRKTSLDELPQLWNVLVGQMSMVGPRPLAVDPRAFTPLEGERHSVLPGITGYWQLSGGPGLSYAEMIRLDLAYIRNWSLFLDVRLILRTVPAMLHRVGAH